MLAAAGTGGGGCLRPARLSWLDSCLAGCVAIGFEGYANGSLNWAAEMMDFNLRDYRL